MRDPRHGQQFAHLLEADSKLDEYREVRAAVGKRLQELVAAAGQPGVVASQDPAPGTKGGASTSVTLVVPRSP